MKDREGRAPSVTAARAEIDRPFSSCLCSFLLFCPLSRSLPPGASLSNFPLLPRAYPRLCPEATAVSFSPLRFRQLSARSSRSAPVSRFLPPMVVQSRRSPPPLSLPYHRFRATNSLGFCLLAPFSLPAGTHPCALPASSDPHGHDREPRPNESRRLSASQPSDSPPRHATPRAACVFEFVFEQPVKQRPLRPPLVRVNRPR